MKKLLLTGLMAVALTWLPAPALAETPLSVKVVAEPAQVKTLLGDRFMITTEITNTSATQWRNSGAFERRQHRGQRIRRSGGLVAGS